MLLKSYGKRIVSLIYDKKNTLLDLLFNIFYLFITK